LKFNEAVKRIIKRALICLCIAVLGYAGWFAWTMFVLVRDEIPTAYAGWAAGELIIEYMGMSNQWPQSIHDLHVAATNRQKSGQAVHWHVHDLTNRLAIPWNVDLAMLLSNVQSQSSFPLLITRRDGKPINPVWGEDVEPNNMLAREFGISNRP
jgi:hypothetical protein